VSLATGQDNGQKTTPSICCAWTFVLRSFWLASGNWRRLCPIFREGPRLSDLPLDPSVLPSVGSMVANAIANGTAIA